MHFLCGFVGRQTYITSISLESVLPLDLAAPGMVCDVVGAAGAFESWFASVLPEQGRKGRHRLRAHTLKTALKPWLQRGHNSLEQTD